MVAHSTAYAAPSLAQPAGIPRQSAARRALIAARWSAINRLIRARAEHRAASEALDALFTPQPRASAAQLAEPILSPHERARVHLDVAICRDGEDWRIGRASPCRWLSVPSTLSPFSP
jgi:hypothetical protein